MQSWPTPVIPRVPGPGQQVRLRDTATGAVVATPAEGTAALYVCGITPYDSTHLGHASTYVAFDTLVRAWLDVGLDVRYAQNVTDVDDPLLERALATGVRWQDLAADQTALFTHDMEALRVVPPAHYVGVVESMPLVVDAVERMVAAGGAYGVDADVYADLGVDARFGSLSHLDREEMRVLFAERGGDPDRSGKRDPLDPVLWRGTREGEPDWDGDTLGRGRPGWHIECAAIAEHHLGMPLTVQGGGFDLVFPHHEMSTSHLRLMTGTPAPARGFMHTGLVAYEGHKMSKSRGNLVFVSQLVADGVRPEVVRLAILAHHYSESWEYTAAELSTAGARLAAWEAAVADPGGTPAADAAAAADVVARLRDAVADDLDTPRALAVVDQWAASGGPADGTVLDAVDALLGIDLR